MHIRKRPSRPYRRGKWFSDIVVYSRECTPQRAWQESTNAAGLYDGLVEAIRASKKDQQQPLSPEDQVKAPRWVLDGLLDYVKPTLASFRVGPKSTRWLRQYRKDAIDFARFDAVHSLHFNYGLTFSDAYEKVAANLRGSAAGGSDAMEASYKKVARAFRAGNWGRYYFSKRIRLADLSE